jgi:hypothetical protein
MQLVGGPFRGLKTRLMTPLNRRKQQGTKAGFGLWLLGGHITLGYVNGATCTNAMKRNRDSEILSADGDRRSERNSGEVAMHIHTLHKYRRDRIGGNECCLAAIYIHSRQ